MRIITFTLLLSLGVFVYSQLNRTLPVPPIVSSSLLPQEAPPILLPPPSPSAHRSGRIAQLYGQEEFARCLKLIEAEILHAKGSYLKWLQKQKPKALRALAWEDVKAGKCNEALTKFNATTGANNGKAYCYYQAGKLAAAETAILEYFAEEKGQYEDYLLHSEILSAQGKYREAAEILSRLGKPVLDLAYKSKMLRSQSSNFDLEYPQSLDSILVTEILDTLETTRLELIETLEIKTAVKKVLKVQLYPAKMFANLMGPHWFGAAFDGEIIILPLPIKAKLLRHELAHGMFAQLEEKLPPWLDEGLAEYFACYKTGCRESFEQTFLSKNLLGRKYFEKNFSSYPRATAQQIYPQSLFLVLLLLQRGKDISVLQQVDFKQLWLQGREQWAKRSFF